LDNNNKTINDRKTLRWLGVGIEFGGVMGIFAYAGYRVDEYYDTKPWLMIVFMFLAFLGEMYLIIKEALSKSE